MKNLQLIIWCGLVLLPLSGHAQKERKISSRIGFEMGFHEFFGSTIVPDRIRSISSVDAFEADYAGDYYMGGYGNQSSHAINKPEFWKSELKESGKEGIKSRAHKPESVSLLRESANCVRV